MEDPGMRDEKFSIFFMGVVVGLGIAMLIVIFASGR
jgi:hypothetical protein